jgi:hypothetical protein
MATSSTHRTGKNLNAKVSILPFQLPFLQQFMFMAMQCKTPTMSMEHLGILDDDFYLLFLCQTIRRLAQNREAARKSRLRKKVNVLNIMFGSKVFKYHGI